MTQNRKSPEVHFIPQVIFYFYIQSNHQNQIYNFATKTKYTILLISTVEFTELNILTNSGIKSRQKKTL